MTWTCVWITKQVYGAQTRGPKWSGGPWAGASV